MTIQAPAAYVAGATVPIRVVIQDSSGGRRRWGFQLSARFSNGQQAGSFQAAEGIAVTPSAGVQYASHNGAANFVGETFNFTVNWTAPASGGNVTFHAAANAANGNGAADAGDHIFTAQFISNAGGAAPAVGSGGVVNGASFTAAPANTVAPGVLFSIFGTNLAPSTAAAQSVPLPTQLGGVEVLVNNRLAPLIFVSPGQINAQLPFETEVGGNANVVVRVNGVSSTAEPVKVDPVSPGIFTRDSSGKGHGIVIHSDNVTPVQPSAPARVGEIVVIYCTGMGQTAAPALKTGEGGASQETLERPTVTIGGQNATVVFSGAVQGFVGLYQVNVIVPGVAAGEHPLIITMPTSQRLSRADVTVAVQP